MPPRLFAEPMAGAACKTIVYFDLETQKSADEVGGWNRIHAMRMSVGVTFNTRRGTYQIYDEGSVNELAEELRRADLVVGFNILRFDYAVLSGYNVLFDPEQLRTLDIMLEISKSVDRRLSLDAVASATLGIQKTGDGMQAIRWFREGRIIDVARYCCYDVKITKLLHEYGIATGQVFYMDRSGKKQRVPVSWRLP
ncbi:MAG: ribonuclease H-like domain-containing protein [Verrucomicrobiae bacterium]|nr:ribonuclease H-like domain-containing protein [Verrucomicrobiae bacterium]